MRGFWWHTLVLRHRIAGRYPGYSDVTRLNGKIVQRLWIVQCGCGKQWPV